MNYNLEWLSANREYLLYEVVAGSHLYGTNTPTSDKDIRGVFILPKQAFLGTQYVEQINDGKSDTIYYELGRFIELISKSNPNILELLYAPEDCILYKSSVMNELLENRDEFLSKDCVNTFKGFAYAQFSKSKGMDKMMNWEKERVTRKTVLDFCYVFENQGTVNITSFIQKNNIKHPCASKLEHTNNVYALYDYEYGKGLAEEESNSLRVSNVPKNLAPVAYFSYNEQAYSLHCKEYLQYQNWLKERNTTRWVEVKTHNQQIDGKNLMHAKRIVNMALDLVNKGTLVPRREQKEILELLSIRKGNVDLTELYSTIEKEVDNISTLLKNSNLPEKQNLKLLNDILVTIRTTKYGF